MFFVDKLLMVIFAVFGTGYLEMLIFLGFVEVVGGIVVWLILVVDRVGEVLWWR